MSTPQAQPMRLYGHHDSGHAYKVRLFLLLTQTPHEYVWVDLLQPREQRPKDFQTASAYGEVPVLLHEGRAWCQSNAILMHLAHRTQQLCGAPDEWARLVEWLFWEPNRINFSVPNLRFAYRYVAQPPEVLNYLKQRAITDLQTLDRHLSKQTFLLASGVTIADLACSSYLYWAEEAQLDLQPYPFVQRWLRDLSSLPHWQSAYQALKPTLQSPA